MPNTITALPLRPDKTVLDTVQAVDDGGWAQNAWNTISGLAHNTWTVYGVAGLLAVLLALSLRSRRKRTRAEAAGNQADLTRTDRAVTLVTGILATAVVATGAWKVFGDVLHLHPAIRLVLFFFAEAQIIAAWRRVRRHIYRHAVLGPGIRTIYGIALGSALVAAFDADKGVEVLLRFFAASVAAYMIAEELAEELDIYLTAHPDLRQADGKKSRGRIKWALNVESILVWLRLAQATERDLEDVERQRRIARFARTAYRLHLLKETAGDTPGRIRRTRIAVVRWQQRRQTEAANEHLALATDPALLADVRAQLALLYGVEGDTSRQAVRDIRPLRPAAQLALASTPFFAEPPRERPDITTGQPTDTIPDSAPANVADTTTGQSVDTAPDSTPDVDPTPAPDTVRSTAPDTTADAPSDTQPGTRTDALTDTGSDVMTDTRPDTATPRVTAARRAPRRTLNRTPKWTKEQLKAFRLRDNNEDITYPQIAREVGVSEKTVSRWFKARAESEKAERDAAAPVTVPDILTPIPAPKEPVTAGTNGHHYSPQGDPS